MGKALNLEVRFHGFADCIDFLRGDYDIQVKADDGLCIGIYRKASNHAIINGCRRQCVKKDAYYVLFTVRRCV